MKNSDPSDIVAAALERVQSLENEIPQLKKLVSDSVAQLAELENSIDFSDSNALMVLTRLQTIATSAPRRLALREADLSKCQADLLTTCHDFISGNLRPRCLDLLKRIKAKVAAKLRSNFTDDESLDEAALNSNLCVEMQAILYRGRVRDSFSPENAKKYALSTIQAWKDAATFEKVNLS
jgi:hypothetical protein